MKDTFRLYSKEECNFCAYAEHALQTYSYEYEKLDIYDHLEALEKEIGERPKTAPQIFIGDVYIGGYEALMDYIDKERMDGKP